MIDRDMIIDLLHAISCQYGGNLVELDGVAYLIEEVCDSAIRKLDDDLTKEMRW